MKTILLISPYWRESHRWMVSSYKLAELWQRLGYKVVVACMGASPPDPSPRPSPTNPPASRERGYLSGEGERKSHVEYVSDTLEIHRIKDFFLPDPWNYGIALGFSGYVQRLASTLQPDIIVVNKLLFWTSIAGLSLKLRGWRVIQITDALVGMTWWPRGWIPRICAAIYAWTLGWILLLCAHRVVFFHPQPEHLLKRLGIAKKSQVIPTGIDVSRFPLPPTPLSRRERGVTGGEVVVTYIGRLESVKGVDDYLAAVEPLAKEIPNVKAQVVGWYEEGNALVTKYQSTVTFTGLRKDIPEILAATDIFVLPSYSEGLSNALMEAMSSSCACIASDVGGNRFLIQNGVSGLLFPAGDREALRSHIRRLIEDSSKRETMGKAARERIEKEFAWEVVGEKYRDFFRSIENGKLKIEN